MRFCVLGPLTIVGPAGPVPVTGRQRRALIAVLLLHPGRIIGVPTLIDRIWGPHRPKSAIANLRTYVYELRQLLRDAGDRADRLVSHSSSYQLNIDSDELDLEQFRLLAAQGREAIRNGDHHQAAALLRGALDLWQGRPFEDMPELEQNLAADVQALEEQHWTVSSDWVDAQLALGYHGAVLPHLRRMVAERPLDEHCWLQLVSALRAAGRTADALAAYRQARQTCIDEIGVEPGEALQSLQAEILDGGRSRTPELVTLPTPRAANPGRPVPAVRRLPGAATTSAVTSNIAQVRQRTVVAPPDRPPLVPTSRSATALPPRPRVVIGRDEELETVLELCRDAASQPLSTASPLTVLLTGATGTGKSTLALAMAHAVRRHYPDGQLYLSLDSSGSRPKSLADALAEVLIILVGPSNVPAEVAQRTALLRRVLNDRRMLLVVDDVPDTESTVPFLTGTGGSLTILTSRLQLSNLDVTWHRNLGPLDTDDGIELLAAMTGRHLPPDGDDGAAARIITHCGGLPLALKTVATRLVLCPQMELTELAERMEGEHAVLDELAATNSSIRKQLRGAYRSLDSGARHTLRRLALAPVRVFTDVTASRAAGLSVPETSRVLVRLVRENLLVSATETADRQRYEIPQLLRVLLREQHHTDENNSVDKVS